MWMFLLMYLPEIGTTFLSAKRNCFCALWRLSNRLELKSHSHRRPCIWRLIPRKRQRRPLVLGSERKPMPELGSPSLTDRAKEHIEPKRPSKIAFRREKVRHQLQKPAIHHSLARV